jgi:hypothetical protein
MVASARLNRCIYHGHGRMNRLHNTAGSRSVTIAIDKVILYINDDKGSVVWMSDIRHSA